MKKLMNKLWCRKWWRIHFQSWFSIPWKITWPSQSFTIFTLKNKGGKNRKAWAKLHDKIEYVVHIRNLKQALNHGLVFKKVNRVIKFSQNAWLKPYIDMNKDLGTEVKNDFEKYLF